MQLTPPCPAPPPRWWMQASELLLHWQQHLGMYVPFVCLLFSTGCVALWDAKVLTNLPVRGFLLFGNFSSFTTPSPWQVSVPYYFVSLFIFCILSYILSKRMGYLSGFLVSSTSVLKLIFGSCLAFKLSFDEFVGEKVVSPSCSSTIL